MHKCFMGFAESVHGHVNMYKKIRTVMLCVLCVLMVLTSCKIQSKPNQTVDVNPINDIGLDKSYELVALKADNQGVELSTAFQLSSKKDIDNSFIKSNLQIIPETDYEIKKLSETSYNIIPAASLENNKVYQIKLDSPEGAYSWAFQTKKKFELETTIPYDKSSYVPANTGIEMYFSMGNLDSIDKYFSIYPEVGGKFIYNKNSVIFVPENELSAGGKYTVTIKKGFGVKDSDEKLSDDYAFSFEIQNPMGIPYSNERLVSIAENNRKIIKGFFNSNVLNDEFKIEIYKFDSADSFSDSLKKFYETNKLNQELGNSNSLVKINTIYQTPYPYGDYSYEGLFELPEDISKGYYLLDIAPKNNDTLSFYQYVQINDMMMYNAVFYNEILLFTLDAASSKAISGTEIYINDKKIGLTKDDGALTSSIDINTFSKSLNVIRAKANGYNDFIYIENLYHGPYSYRWYGNNYDADNNRYKYFSYVYTDRSAYLSTDTISLWGFARLKDDTRVKQVKLELVEPGTEIVLETKYVDLTDIGTYQTEFSINNYTGDYGIIYVYHNDKIIDSKYFNVKDYVKPLYYIESEFDKNYVYSGDPLKFTLRAKFFDGYPVKGATLRYGNSSGIYSKGVGHYKVAALNDNGEVTLDIDTHMKSDNWRPQSVSIFSSNDTAEETTIKNYNSYVVFPKHQMLEIERDDKKSNYFSVLLHELDNSTYDTDKYEGYESLRSNPINADVKVEVIETYYEKHKAGESYDFINKVNVITYSYTEITNTVYSNVVHTEDGKYRIEIPNYNPDRYYKAVARYDDKDGGIYEERSVGGLEYSYYPYDRNYYTLYDNKKGNEPYKLNEDIKVSLMYNSEEVKNVENDKLIVLFMNNGLLEYMISDETSIKNIFKNEFVSNVWIDGAYVKNGYIHPIENKMNLTYDYSERQIFFDVTTNKEEYRPGEEVSININAYDKDKNPIIADVNLSVVDEAFFALFPQSVDTAASLYSSVYYTGLISTYMSNSPIKSDIAAEKGGGGDELADIIRDDFKDNNLFKTVRTDKNGKASVKFKLADNITSWRITYQAISDKKYVGSGKKNIAVSLPFYMDMIMYKKYLIEDNIGVSLRIFGKDAVKGEKVEYKVVVKNKDTNKEEEFTLNSAVGEYANINVGKKPEGVYEIYAYASSGSYKDAIKEEFEVVESYVYFNNSNTYKLSDNTVLEKVYSNPVITLYNDSKSDFFNSLRKIMWADGKRIDQTVCSLISRKFINEYFELNWEYSEDELTDLLNEYQIYNGGFSLLPYSGPDTEVTAKLIYLVNDENIYKKSKIFFDEILSEEKYSTKIATALWGLAKNREPILLKLYELLENNSLPVRDRLYLCLALAELGDNEAAQKHYKAILDNSVKASGEYLYLENNIDSADNYELTALMSILSAKLKDFKNGDRLFRYVYKNPSKYTLSNFEQLIYIMNRDILSIDEIKDLFGEVTVTIGTDVKNYKLKLFDTESFSVKKEDIGKVKFSNIKGDIMARVSALGNKDDLNKNKSEDVQMDVIYSQGNSSSNKNTYKQSELISVTINPRINSDDIGSLYEVTYVLPSGFRFVKESSSNQAHISENGQKLICRFSDSKKYPAAPVVFYIQAAQSGEYTADYTVIKDMLSDRLNYVEKTKLIIE